MRFAIVSRHIPDPEGTAAGRILFATCSGLIADGHEVQVCSWGFEQPTLPLPPWCEWRPVVVPRGLALLESYVRPVSEVLQIDWRPPEDQDGIAIADDPPSWPAVANAPRSAVTIHYLTKLDVRALGVPNFRQIQERRAERRAVRGAPLVLAYSERVARSAAAEAVAIPVAFPVPERPIDPVADPVAAVVADWRWPPNAVALRSLLEAWPEVRRRKRDARLLLAGRGLDGIASHDGVESVGVPVRSLDVLARAAVLTFPAPDTSGPKIKVLEALAHGLPVVTTPPGVEGLRLRDGDGAVVVPLDRFADAVARLLDDKDERARLAASGRAAVLSAHAPIPAARARVRAVNGDPG